MLERQVTPPPQPAVRWPKNLNRQGWDSRCWGQSIDWLYAAYSVQRVSQERLNRALPNLVQVMTVGARAGDPRSPWALSVVYARLAPPDFDRAHLVCSAIDASREPVATLKFPRGWLPAEFTVPELMRLSGAILRRALDKVTFRRHVLTMALLQGSAARCPWKAHTVQRRCFGWRKATDPPAR